ncbi:hypothetical protein A3H26_03130 [candidate division WWE3 bacterium RIFCSPLOWO2_12_FULL_36_10]|uniref:Uncharacterized protein n=1 Tax=candidate division WWE3 bacterium RIFCSPLOWO2_12_FULL_36_10 TaxID=1802630 RepID=A0A1F4VIZ3_UNCKA|nr:MAG: hypothetical protein A3H26_03130 [candidate division WWE3 bacterium RIFCSPLOWO2_12_FULL_36_10]
MPGFLYTVIFADLISWGLLTWFIISVKPDSTRNIIFFLLLLLVCLSLLISVPLYFRFQKYIHGFKDEKKVYRKSLKWSFFNVLLITSVLALRAFKLFSLINIFLLGIFFITLVIYIKNRRI